MSDLRIIGDTAAFTAPAESIPDRGAAHLAEIRRLLDAAGVDPDTKLRVVWAAIDYGAAQARHHVDWMSEAWRRSIERKAK